MQSPPLASVAHSGQAQLTAPPQSGWRGWRLPVVMLAIFLCGMIAGISGTVLYSEMERRMLFSSPEKMLAHQLATINRKLKLTPEQAARVEEIFRRRHGKVHQRLLDTADFMLLQLNELENELNERLSEAQQAALKSHFAEIRQRLPPFQYMKAERKNAADEPQ